MLLLLLLMMMMMMMTTTKKENDNWWCLLYIYGKLSYMLLYIFMENFLTCYSQNAVSSGNTYIKIHQEELLFYMLFEFKWGLILQLPNIYWTVLSRVYTDVGCITDKICHTPFCDTRKTLYYYKSLALWITVTNSYHREKKRATLHTLIFLVVMPCNLVDKYELNCYLNRSGENGVTRIFEMLVSSVADMLRPKPWFSVPWQTHISEDRAFKHTSVDSWQEMGLARSWGSCKVRL